MRNLRKFLKYGLYAFTVLLVVLFLGHWLTAAKLQSWFVTSQISQQFDIVTTADGSTNLYVKPSALPKTQDQRLAASDAQLLPSEWESDPIADGQQASPTVSPIDQKTLLTFTRSFLTAWETFRPWNQATYNAWASKVSNYVAQGYVDSVVGRVDVIQPKTICPEDGCPVGSTFIGIDPSTFTIRSYSGQTAYLTVDGYVHYREVVGGATQSAYRQYALLLSRNATGSGWQVTRAASTTLDTPSS